MDVIEALDKLIVAATDRTLNEADTRHRIIDFVLHDLLGWPKNRVAHEEYIHEGFADYVLKKASGDSLLFIEAKKEGFFFDIPLPSSQGELSSFVSISKLTSDPNVKSAMLQVRAYCLDSGCEYGGITNGHEWVFFKIFEKGKKWESMQAFVVRSLRFFRYEYTKAIKHFSFSAIDDRASLAELLTSSPPKDRSVYFPKQKIASYSHQITSNRLAVVLRPIITKYFGVIEDNDSEFMERCYVSRAEYDGAQKGMRELLHDSLTPYLEQYNVQQLDVTGKGGRLGGRLTKHLKERRKNEVLVLFGGKGAGKSTFIKRLLHHNPPRWLREHAVTAIVDLLTTPENKDTIRKAIWSGLQERLDSHRLLEGAREDLLNGLFSDRYEVAQRQDLAGLREDSVERNLKLNELVAEWRRDTQYCCRKLVGYWEGESRGVVVVVDNTDQYSSEIQDFCFASAQEIARELGCLVLVSMREERFYSSKIHGLLDAFQNAGFHISSPKPSDVFRKRLDYTVSLLSEGEVRSRLLERESYAFIDDCIKYLTILSRQFTDHDSPLNKFLTACAHGDIRLSLDLFRSFLLSGYTNVDEMIDAGHWNFLSHQVIKPIMIPNRYFYDEGLSEVPNIYQLRSHRHTSHFTSLRILRKLGNNVDVAAPPYVANSELRTYFVETFNMSEDYEKAMDVLLKHGCVEASNRLDRYSDDVDSLKITSYGLYVLRSLSYEFTYLDLVCTDSGIFSEKVSNYLSTAAKQEYGLFTKGERVQRIEVRLGRVDEFLKYLEGEEQRERDLYSLGMPQDEMFTAIARKSFATERDRVLASARRQPKKAVTRRPKSS